MIGSLIHAVRNHEYHGIAPVTTALADARDQDIVDGYNHDLQHVKDARLPLFDGDKERVRIDSQGRKVVVEVKDDTVTTWKLDADGNLDKKQIHPNSVVEKTSYRTGNGLSYEVTCSDNQGTQSRTYVHLSPVGDHLVADDLRGAPASVPVVGAAEARKARAQYNEWVALMRGQRSGNASDGPFERSCDFRYPRKTYTSHVNDHRFPFVDTYRIDRSGLICRDRHSYDNWAMSWSRHERVIFEPNEDGTLTRTERITETNLNRERVEKDVTTTV